MGDDEEATIHTLKTYREVISGLIEQHHGRVVDSPGDNLLAEFASAVDAVQAAVAIQQELKTRNAELEAHRQMKFRIGLNVGDVITDEGRLYGDGVNIAARLEGLADPGGICLSGTVYDQIANKLDVPCTYQGEQSVKNIAKPVRAYKVQLESEGGATSTVSQEQPVPGPVKETGPLRRWPMAALAVVAVLVVGAGVLVVREFTQQPVSSQTALSPEEVRVLPLPDKPSIAVLPFTNMSGDPEQEYFSDGMTETLITDLSRISSLFVIARNSVFTYKGKPVKIQQVGRELGVRYVLEGSVQKADDQVRINAQLVEAATGQHLWAERYDRDLHDLFALQDEIVQQIVTTLELQLTLQEQGFLVRKRTDNLAAYDFFLRGLEYHYRFTKEAMSVQARQMFEKAIELDPQYAEAYVQLGLSYYMAWVWGWNRDPTTLEKAFALVQQAHALDDSLPFPHILLGRVHLHKQQYDQAVAGGERAIALDPNQADSYAWQAATLIFAGRPADALRSVEQAMRLNPRYPAWYLMQLGGAYHFLGRYAEATSAQKTLLRGNPNIMLAYQWLVINYVAQWIDQQSHDPQDLEQALTAAQRALAWNDSVPYNHLALGYVYLWQKQHEQAIAEMERAIALAPNDAITSATLAYALGCVSRPEEAVRMAEQALRGTPFIVDRYLGSVGAAYSLAGQPEEAIAPLQQYLARYPNHLNVHLTLAAAYSEVGRAAEARAEVAEVLRLNPQFSLEVHQERVLIKDLALLERHLAALRQAGLK